MGVRYGSTKVVAGRPWHLRRETSFSPQFRDLARHGRASAAAHSPVRRLFEAYAVGRCIRVLEVRDRVLAGAD